jgi:LysM repeat protein
LTNANRITVGQVLALPATNAPGTGGQPIPTPGTGQQPTPSPQTETTYTVRPNDNLFRIGLAYGIGWVQIAEANGLISPSQIYVGQVLKIPVNRPGPMPEFTHQVRAGESLLRIALLYGIPWTTIAEANNLTSPYVIYPGQTLVIPGQ